VGKAEREVSRTFTKLRARSVTGIADLRVTVSASSLLSARIILTSPRDAAGKKGKFVKSHHVAGVYLHVERMSSIEFTRYNFRHP
jgi:hypothetical protein